VRAVSFKDSPFDTDDPDGVNDIVSADRALAARSNDIRVRVDDS
jgi:hypothetical protein